jgi:hypothetical protein
MKATWNGKNIIESDEAIIIDFNDCFSRSSLTVIVPKYSGQNM